MKLINLSAGKRSGRALVLVILLLLPALALAQLPAPTYGWNLGNTMEPPTGEGTWAPAATQQLINAVAAAGFNTIRIPVAWNSHANQTTGQIDPAWMARVKEVVDWSRAANLTVVINSHWDDGWLDSKLDGNVDADVNARMQSYWTQIANAFVDYDSKLLFSGANEPPADTAEKMSELLTYYQTFVNAVRATGGQNKNRWLVLSGPNTNIDLTCNLMNTLPSDTTPGRLIVEVHDYSPYQYTLMDADATWGKMSYFWGQGYHHATRADRNATLDEEDYIQAQYQKMKTKFVDQGVPVLLGEFGTGLRTGYSDLTGADYSLHVASRTYWNKTLLDSANARGIRPIYWDNGWAGKNGFALFDRITAAILDQASITSLTGGPALPPPTSQLVLSGSTEASLAPRTWNSSGPIIAPVADGTHPIVSVKDPTVVQYGGRWHVFTTTADKNGAWSMAYFNFRSWAEAAEAKPYYLDQNPNLAGYNCAPQVFYFRPQKKWYLIFQSPQPRFSTTGDLSKPETWSAPRSFFKTQPASVVQGWLDYWIICDDTHAYLFFSDDHGRFYRSRTRLESFPEGFDEPVVAMRERRAGDLFEASCVYRVKGTNEYLCLIECMGKNGQRYFRAFTSDQLDGVWKPLAGADSWERPFAGANNVTGREGGVVWTDGISHGELLRDGCDETMTIDSTQLQFLYQGMARGVHEKNYVLLPYRLGLLRSVNVANSAGDFPGETSATVP